MALPQNPRLNDIIETLEDLTLINYKQEIINVVGSPLDSDSSSQDIVNTIQQGKNELASNFNSDSNLPLLELIASSGNLLQFQTANIQSIASNTLFLENLPFRPILLILKRIDTITGRTIGVWLDNTFTGTTYQAVSFVENNGTTASVPQVTVTNNSIRFVGTLGTGVNYNYIVAGI